MDSVVKIQDSCVGQTIYSQTSYASPDPSSTVLELFFIKFTIMAFTLCKQTKFVFS